MQPANPLPPPAVDPGAEDLVLVEAPDPAAEAVLSMSIAPAWPPPIDEQEQVEFLELGEAIARADVTIARETTLVAPASPTAHTPDDSQSPRDWDHQPLATLLGDPNDPTAVSPWGAVGETEPVRSNPLSESLNQQVSHLLALVGRWSRHGEETEPPDSAGWDGAVEDHQAMPAAAADAAARERHWSVTEASGRWTGAWAKPVAASFAAVLGAGVLWFAWVHSPAGSAESTTAQPPAGAVASSAPSPASAGESPAAEAAPLPPAKPAAKSSSAPPPAAARRPVEARSRTVPSGGTRRTDPVAAPAASQARLTEPRFIVREAPADVGADTLRDVQAEVLQALASYRQAYAGLDADEARRIWPGMEASALTRAFAGMQPVRLAFDQCDLAVQPLAATATCRGRTTEPARGQRSGSQVRVRSWVFTLAQGPNGWTTEHTEVN